MKKIFQIIGLISLTCFSFFVTEKTATVVNDMDEIMIEIKEKKDNFKRDPIDAVINENEIIPGVNGRVVNINKSYKNMKSKGYYNENLYVYDYTKPSITLNDNINKYIIKGNPSKRMVSLSFIVQKSDDITDIVNIINNYNIKANFFVDYNWFSSNNELVKQLISKGHNIGFIVDDNDSNLEWMDMVIKKVNKQSHGFCYNDDKNEDKLFKCVSRNDYTITPTIISDKTPLVDIKNKLESGSILLLSNNSEVRRQLSTIIIYIKSKGYNITNLEENVLE